MLFTAELYNTVCQIYHENAAFHNSLISHNVPEDHFVSVHINTAYIFKNVSRIDVDGDKVILRDIMGDERVVEGRILMVDLANSIVKLCCE